MMEDGVLTHMPPEKCLSRHDEIQNQKTEQSATFDSQGNLKISKKAADLSCDTTGELKLRQAFTRKALAFDQAGLCSFATLEQWHTQMMHATMRPPPSGHKYVTIQQVLNADQELWSLMSQETRKHCKLLLERILPWTRMLKRFGNHHTFSASWLCCRLQVQCPKKCDSCPL